MTYPKPKNEEEKKKFRRFDYEEQKEGLIEFHKSEGYDPNTLNEFVINSLKNMGFEQELKEDGVLQSHPKHGN